MSRPPGDTTLTARDRNEATPPPAEELSLGAKVGRYVIEERLGAGGMGVVYSAWDAALARSVALKVVRPRAAMDITQARLRREAKAMARLSHRNVVPVFDIATHDGQLFIAMELVEGESLRAWVTRQRPWREVVALFVKAGHGLEAAHTAGLAHRDFKPDNVMVGEGSEPRITDFGLARDLDDGPTSPVPFSSDRNSELLQVTATGSHAGTPAYMAPEQLLDNRSGPAADQFSFCVSLFEVLYGVRPFRTTVRGHEALLDEVRAGRVVKPAVTRGVPRWLHAVIVRGLAFAPEDRWPSMVELVAALDRKRWRRWWPALGAAGALAVAAAVLGVRSGTASEPAPTCSEATAKANDAIALVVCRDEYTRTGDLRAGTMLADALRRTRNLKEAAVVANELLATSARAEALYTLGKIAAEEERRGDAARSLRLASELHRQQQRWAKAAQDQLALAGVTDDVVEQLVSLEQAASDAQRGGDRKIEAYCHLGSARRLSEIGARAGALEALDRATPLLTTPSDRMRLDVERGNVYQNLDEHALALDALERALRGEATGNARSALSLHLNLAYSLAAVGRMADAAAQIAESKTLDPGDRQLADRQAVEAWVTARAGDPARAAGLIERSLAATEPDAIKDLQEREIVRAGIALARGDLTAAEAGARRAIARIEAVSSTSEPVELPLWSLRRAPYEQLFASLARRGDAAGALAVFERYRGPAVLAALVGDGEARSGDVLAWPLAHQAWPAQPAALGDTAGKLPAAPFPTAEVARLVPQLHASRLASPAPEPRLREAMRTASILALVVAGDEVWRITADQGRTDLARVDTLAALRPMIERLRASPGDRGVAASLGELLVPASLARSGDQVLHVVLDEPLAGLPVAALRVGGSGGRRLVALRPIVRAALPSDAADCAPAHPAPHRVVGIDASGELAAPLRGVFPGATRDALFGVARGDLLHLAVPAERSQLGDLAVLGKDRISALEVAAHGGAPAQIVIAMRDLGPHGSSGLAMGFVAAGAEQVIATVGPVSEAAAEQLADKLYRSNVSDLVRALARAQADGDESWLGFAVFGRASCKPSP